VFLAGVGAILDASRPYLTDPDKALPTILGGYLVVMLWGVLTLGLPLAWYRAAVLRQLVAHTRFDGVSFSLQATTGGLISLALGIFFISALSLGILRPWAALRTFRFACRHLRATGEPDWARIHQGIALRSRTGEGLAAVFDGAGEF